jgi:indole-3-glycerol phosphate synthase
MLAPHLDMHELARLYADNGAAALSVLTDEHFFLGRLETLKDLRRAPEHLPPLLRKEFILSPAQVYETRAAGADAVLLIAAALPGDELEALHTLALGLGLTPLVEVHTQAEVERVARLPGLQLVGINNRNLENFDVDLKTTVRLRPHVPPGVRVVSESGIFTSADVARLAAVGVDAVLVGEALVTASDIAAKVRELSGYGD